MASVFPLANYHTVHVALTDNNLTTIYTNGTGGEIAFDVTSISVAATAAFADTCSVYHASGGTDWVLVFKGPVEADYPLQIEGMPIHMVGTDAIKATATAGATHTLHVSLSGIKTVRATDPK